MPALRRNNMEEEIAAIEVRKINKPTKKISSSLKTDESIKELVEYFDGDESIADEANVAAIREGLTELYTHGYSSTIVQVCKGIDCPLAYKCPLVKLHRIPLGKECFIEKQLIKRLREEYTTAIVERLNLDFDNLVDADIITRNLIIDLVEADILELRANAMISVEGFIAVVPVVVTSDGRVETKKEEHMAFRIKEIVKKRRDIVYKQLLATPEMRMKYRKGEKKKDSAKEISATVQKAVDSVKSIEGQNNGKTTGKQSEGRKHSS